jgi:hypothetical protein
MRRFASLSAVVMLAASLLVGAPPLTAAARCGGARLAASPDGDAWVGRFVRIYGPESDEDPQALWRIERLVTGDQRVVDGEMAYLDDSCAPPTFRRGARYLVTTGHWPPSTTNTVAWRILGDGRVRLVTWLPASAYPERYRVDTLDEALAVVRRGSLPPTDTAPAAADPGSAVGALVSEVASVLTAVIALLQRAP